MRARPVTCSQRRRPHSSPTFLLLPVFLCSLLPASQAADAELRAVSGRSFYTEEPSGRLLITQLPEGMAADNLLGSIAFAGRTLVSGAKLDVARFPAFSFPLADLPTGDTELLFSLASPDGRACAATVTVTKLPPRSNAVKIDRFGGGLVVDGLPYLPVGFYCYSPVQTTLAEEEVVRGFNMMSPYQKNDPDRIDERMAWMDRCAALGMKVHYQLLRVAGGGGVYGARGTAAQWEDLRREVAAFRDHPALLAWYISDEPTGHGATPEALAAIRESIVELDPYHPVTVVFMRARRAQEYAAGLDIAMTDPYPVPVRPVSSVADAVRTVHDAVAPADAVWLVPQCFGGNEHWRREPTASEQRVMTYLGIIEGATGVQYFIRHGLNGFPKSTTMWGECAAIALELGELTPYLLSGEPRPLVQVTRGDRIRASGWRRGDHILVIAVNHGDTPQMIELRSREIDADSRAQVLFGGRLVRLHRRRPGWLRRLLRIRRGTSAGTPATVWTDMIDGQSTRIYEFSPTTEAEDVSPAQDRNLIVNPGFEQNPMPGVPAGCYAGVGKGRGATYRVDPRVAWEGRHSLRLHTPAEGEGVTIRPFSPYVEAGVPYCFQLQAKARAGDPPASMVLGMRGATETSMAVTTEWGALRCATVPRAGATRLRPYYRLQSAGTVWVDGVEVFALTPELRLRRSVDNEVVLELDPPVPGMEMRYEVGDSPPDGASTLYQKPFTVPRASNVGIWLKDPQLGAFIFTKTLSRHDANALVPSLARPYSSKYSGGGPGALTDGLLADATFRHPCWQGYVGADLAATFDLGEVTTLREVRGRFLQARSSWIFLPVSLRVYTSLDGRRYRGIGLATHSVALDRKDAFIHELTVTATPAEARYVRVVAESPMVCPPRHPGAGKACWVFCDEMLVNPQ